MKPSLDQPETWPGFKPPMIIAHDVGRSRDRSTAVVGGVSPFQSSIIGIQEFGELPQNLYGSARASALAQVDRRHNSNALIVADLSNDESVWMAATLDGLVEPTGAVFESKFMLPWSFSEQAAAEKHMAQLQHNMCVVGTKNAVLSIITGGGKWVEIAISADPVYQTALIYAERSFWRAVSSGEPPALFHAEPPRARIEAVKIVDMNSSNAWAQLAALFRNTRSAHLEHERSKSELKTLMPEDAKEAMGHGIRAKRSKSGAVSFDVLEVADAAL